MGGESAKAMRFLEHLAPLRGSLEAYCRRTVNQPSKVEDTLQSTVMKAFEDFHRYVEDTNFRAWIFRYLNFEILNRNRKSQPTVPLSTEVSAGDSWNSVIAEATFAKLHEDPDAVLDHCDDVVAAAVRELPSMERSVLLLRAIGEFEYREIAEVLDIPMGSVMGYLGRSRAMLRRKLMDHCRQQGLLRDADPSVTSHRNLCGGQKGGQP